MYLFFRLLLDSEYSSPCYVENPCLSILYIVVYILLILKQTNKKNEVVNSC